MPNSPQTMTCMEVWGGSSLTDNAVSVSGLDAWVFSKPFAASTSGGDVYYLSSCATGRITRILLADVSGHGNAVTETAVTLRNLMRRYVNHLDQSSFVKSLNAHFTRLSQTGTFATAVAATFFGPTNDLTLCNAGHPTPLLFRSDSNSWSLLQHTSTADDQISDIPLGIDDIATYTQLALSLSPSDLVLCYSDSLIESRNPAGNFLGESGLLDVITQLPGNNPATLIPTLLQKIASLHPTNLTEDDVTILLFRPNHTRPTPNFLSRAYAPLRILGRSLLSLFPHQSPAPIPDISYQNIVGAIIPAANKRRPNSSR